ncbi:hypothetical protein WM08_18265 [Burkholderia ubonensis]|uniref:FecR domain-containing protein n=1 Tax=Burkholderia ubonensis TaxID=101571 RepID=UPI00075F8F08|nr:FecR domain-containing protein [Burkholderia ubonensis]KWI62829.1 hypothetical protein WM07_22430 [Burkholderia ubonensis]KWI86841.1 hypothetical protein WM08_18265 [Burkholderia ubonensis]
MQRFGDVDDPRRRILIRALAAGFFAASTGAGNAIAAGIFGGRPAKLPPGQSIYSVDGACKINGKPATIDSHIKPGDTVETGPRSQLIFVVGETSMLLRNDSNLMLSATADDPVSEIVGSMKLLNGKLLSVFAPGRPVRIETPSASIGIRGTGLYLEADPEQTYFCTCYGATHVAAKDDPQSTDTVVSTHHNKPLYVLPGNKNPGKSILPAPFKNHTDQELALIETLVGRELPQSFPALPDARYGVPSTRNYTP